MPNEGGFETRPYKNHQRTASRPRFGERLAHMRLPRTHTGLCSTEEHDPKGRETMANLLCVGTAGMSVWFSRDDGDEPQAEREQTTQHAHAQTHPAPALVLVRRGRQRCRRASYVLQLGRSSGVLVHAPGDVDGVVAQTLVETRHELRGSALA